MVCYNRTDASGVQEASGMSLCGKKKSESKPAPGAGGLKAEPGAPAELGLAGMGGPGPPGLPGTPGAGPERPATGGHASPKTFVISCDCC